MGQTYYAPQRFSVRNALTRWFRLWSARPGDAARLVVWDILIGGGLIGAYILTLVLFIGDASAVAEPPPEQQAAIMARMMAAFAIMFFGVLPWMLASDAAWHRLLVGRPAARVIPYRLWADEGRIALVAIIAVGIAYAAMFVLLFPMMYVAMWTISADPTSQPGPATALIPFLMLLVMMLINVAIYRLLVGGPIAVLERRTVALDGWTATRPFVWRFVASLIALVAIYMICAFLVLIPSLSAATSADIPATESAGTPIDPQLRLLIGIGGAAYAVFAYVYLQIHRGVLAEAAVVAHARKKADMAAAATPPS